MDPSSPTPPGPGPEEQLLLRVGRGDVGALEALYARFARPLMTFLHALTHDAALAEDLVQETFVSAWQAAPRWQPRGRASTWLFTIARRAAGHARDKRRPVSMAQPPERSTDVAEPRGADDLGPRLARAIESLSEPLRVAFVLVRVNGLALLEAAEVLEVPEGTLKSRLAAAEARLRLLLGDVLRDAPPGAAR
jgi:RNA polymerase sigma-70 factor, ECF subfamily